MFIAYFLQRNQSDSNQPHQAQPEMFDEFGDPIENEQITADQLEIREKFNGAADILPKIMKLIDEKTILRLYALYKQATVGPADAITRPSLLDFKGRTKFDAWKKLDKMDKFDAMKEYTEIVNNIAPHPGDLKGNQGFGLKPSTFEIEEVDIDSLDNSGKWFHAAKTGNIAEVQRALSRDPALLNSKDPVLGMTALLWAADAGHVATVHLLIECGADVNAVDDERNTALHLAATCRHMDVYNILKDLGADVNAVNNDGETVGMILAVD